MGNKYFKNLTDEEREILANKGTEAPSEVYIYLMNFQITHWQRLATRRAKNIKIAILAWDKNLVIRYSDSGTDRGPKRCFEFSHLPFLQRHHIWDNYNLPIHL